MRRGLGVAALWVVIAFIGAVGEGFPLTLGAETAYTLSQGQWLIGALRLPGEPVSLLQLEASFGLTDSLQIETKPLALFLGFLNGEIKYELARIKGAVLSIGASVTVPFELQYVGLGVKGYLSFPGRLAWHVDLALPLLPAIGISVSLAADFSLFPWLHILGEIGFPPPKVLGGALMRLWEFGLLRAVVGVEINGAGPVPFSYVEFFALFGAP